MSAGFQGTVDWTGLPAGAPPALGGFSGTVDWTGIPCGAPPARGGYHGIIDWTGIPCGAGTSHQRNRGRPDFLPGPGDYAKQRRLARRAQALREDEMLILWDDPIGEI